MITRIPTADYFGSSSCFLWGPRQVGKSTLLRTLFPESPYYDLLDTRLFRRLSRDPGQFYEEIRALTPTGNTNPIILDEVQKLPELLDETHRLITERGLSFILCGSSARKLMRGGGNLLGGRATRKELLPLSYREIPNFSLDRAINHGLLPPHYLGETPDEFISAYVGTYLKEEIMAESLVRSLPVFQRFLEVAALTNAQPVNFSSIGREVGLSAAGVRGYFEILTDTLLGFWVPAWRKSKKRRLVAAPRFYFADISLVNELARRTTLLPGSTEYGAAFEHFIFMELRAWSVYRNQNLPLSYWRTSSGQEVDFILGDGQLALEIKSSDNPTSDHLKGLRAWKEEHPNSRCILVCRSPAPRLTRDHIHILPWQTFLDQLWDGSLTGQ